MKTRYKGSVSGIYVCNKEDALDSVPVDKLVLDFLGIVGDKHAGHTKLSDSRTPWYKKGTEVYNDRQISIVSEEEINDVAKTIGLEKIFPESLGANILIKGVPNFTRIMPTARIFFESGCVLKIEAGNMPCAYAGRMVDSYAKDGVERARLFTVKAVGKRGVVATVEKPGVVLNGEAFAVKIPS